MRRTQLYLDDQLWNVLHSRAKSAKTTISQLVREAVRERFLGSQEQKRTAMLQFIGIRKDSEDSPDAVEYVQNLRRSSRMKRLAK